MDTGVKLNRRTTDNLNNSKRNTRNYYCCESYNRDKCLIADKHHHRNRDRSQNWSVLERKAFFERLGQLSSTSSSFSSQESGQASSAMNLTCNLTKIPSKSSAKNPSKEATNIQVGRHLSPSTWSYYSVDLASDVSSVEMKENVVPSLSSDASDDYSTPSIVSSSSSSSIKATTTSSNKTLCKPRAMPTTRAAKINSTATKSSLNESDFIDTVTLQQVNNNNKNSKQQPMEHPPAKPKRTFAHDRELLRQANVYDAGSSGSYVGLSSDTGSGSSPLLGHYGFVDGDMTSSINRGSSASFDDGFSSSSDSSLSLPLSSCSHQKQLCQQQQHHSHTVCSSSRSDTATTSTTSGYVSAVTADAPATNKLTRCTASTSLTTTNNDKLLLTNHLSEPPQTFRHITNSSQRRERFGASFVGSSRWRPSVRPPLPPKPFKSLSNIDSYEAVKRRERLLPTRSDNNDLSASLNSEHQERSRLSDCGKLVRFCSDETLYAQPSVTSPHSNCCILHQAQHSPSANHITQQMVLSKIPLKCGQKFVEAATKIVRSTAPNQQQHQPNASIDAVRSESECEENGKTTRNSRNSAVHIKLHRSNPIIRRGGAITARCRPTSSTITTTAVTAQSNTLTPSSSCPFSPAPSELKPSTTNTSITDVDDSNCHLNRIEEQEQKSARVQVSDRPSSSRSKSTSQNKNPVQSKGSIRNNENAECKLRRRVTKAKLVHRRTLAHYDEQVNAFRRLMTPKLFDMALVVSLVERNESNELPYKNVKSAYVPVVSYRYPELEEDNGDDKRSTQRQRSTVECADLFIPDFTRAHPYHSTKEWTGNEEFMLTLTDEHGKRTFAYCIKYLPRERVFDTETASTSSAAELCVNGGCMMAEVFAIISPIHAPTFYTALARECVNYLQQGRSTLKNLLDAVFRRPFPSNGGTLCVAETTGRTKKREIVIRSQGPTPGRADCSSVVKRMGAEVTVSVLAALLAEQKVLIGGDSVQSVCHAVQSLVSLLQPFSWPYTLVPVLPDTLLELANSPTPYLLGVLRNNLYKLRDLLVGGYHNSNSYDNNDADDDLIQDDVIIVDLDGGIFVPQPSEQYNAAQSLDYKEKSALALCEKLLLPKKLAMNLIVSFREALANGPGPVADDLIQKAMLTWLASLVGHYKWCGLLRSYTADCDGDPEPLRLSLTQLVNAHESTSARRFTEWFVETGLFRDWVRRRVCSTPEIRNRIWIAGEDAANQRLDELAVTFAPQLSNTSSFNNRFSHILSRAHRALFRSHLHKKY